MIVIPAIDLHDGHVVRLKQGAFDDVTYYNPNPADVAKTFQDAGARRIHVVDLDGSDRGNSVNTPAIKAICRAVEVEVELGGGIRSAKDAGQMFDLGVDFVILGTLAVKDPDAAREIIRQFPDHIGIGIDAIDGRVAVHAWKEVSDTTALDLAKSFDVLRPAFVVYTDIKRDGMLTGPNIEATAAMVNAVNIPVIASGGVASMDDLIALCAIPSLFGAISGKAIYEGRLNLKEAFEKIQSS